MPTGIIYIYLQSDQSLLFSKTLFVNGLCVFCLVRTKVNRTNLEESGVCVGYSLIVTVQYCFSIYFNKAFVCLTLFSWRTQHFGQFERVERIERLEQWRSTRHIYLSSASMIKWGETPVELERATSLNKISWTSSTDHRTISTCRS